MRLQEQVADLQSQLHTLPPPPPGGASSTASTASDLDQLDRLKEALRRLQGLHMEDAKRYTSQIQALTEEGRQATRLGGEVHQLRAERDSLAQELAKAREQISDLCEQVDDASSLNSLVESVTTKNLEMTALVRRLKTEISDLEASAEIAEQIDAQQHQEIAALRYGCVCEGGGVSGGHFVVKARF